jgi:L-2,4-diaminobutyrate decarboxylase
MDTPLFLTSDPASRAAYRDAILQAADLLLGALPAQPYSGAAPRQLNDLFSQPLDNDGEWTAELREIIAHSVQPAHPRTVAHLHCAPLIPALAAEVILSALNQSMDSFDQAPAATLIEQKVLRWLCSAIGLPSASGGIHARRDGVELYGHAACARSFRVAKVELAEPRKRSTAGGRALPLHLLRRRAFQRRQVCDAAWPRDGFGDLDSCR